MQELNDHMRKLLNFRIQCRALITALKRKVAKEEFNMGGFIAPSTEVHEVFDCFVRPRLFPHAVAFNKDVYAC